MSTRSRSANRQSPPMKSVRAWPRLWRQSCPCCPPPILNHSLRLDCVFRFELEIKASSKLNENVSGRRSQRNKKRLDYAAGALTQEKDNEVVESAMEAGLRYVSDDMPGIKRGKLGNGFRYRYRTGDIVQESEVLDRIKSLAIPPAWTDVWICPDPAGHLQATGRDDRHRKQHRYHARWRQIRDEDKYGRMIAFGKALPRIRKRVLRDLSLRGLTRDKVLAAVVRLLEVSLIRVGNEEYARENDSFGLTTMRGRHVNINGSTVQFHFHGKAGKWHTVDIRDRRLARIVKSCQELPGQELFQYVDDEGKRQDVKSTDVNDYLREIGA